MFTTAFTFILTDEVHAQSALSGGLVAWIPNVYFALKCGTFDSSKSEKDVVGIFYAGEIVKLFMTSVLFILLFQLLDVKVFPLFLSFSLVLSIPWFALLVRNNTIE